MTSDSKRVQRVKKELSHILSQHLVHGLPRALACFASITAVDVTPNLRQARVFFRLVGDEPSIADAKSLLEKERSTFQKAVAQKVKIKFTPVLRFDFGVAPELDEVDRLLAQLRKG